LLDNCDDWRGLVKENRKKKKKRGKTKKPKAKGIGSKLVFAETWGGGKDRGVEATL